MEQMNKCLKETPHLEADQTETRRAATKAETGLVVAETVQTAGQLERENL
jgi:hypothetical protein